MRIDRLLCNLRFLRTRTLAAELVRRGHVRRNGARLTKSSQEVAVGDVLTLPLGATVRLVEVLSLPDRRGPASEAQACYRVLDAQVDPALDPIAQTDIGAAKQSSARGDARP